jgi:hypothetical protein
MPRRTALHRTVGYIAVTTLLVSAGLSAGGLFFQLAEQGGHAHAGLSAGEQTLGFAVDAAGFALALLLSLQMMLGQQLFDVSAERFRTVHSGVAWSVVALAGLHGVGAVTHTLQGAVEALPVWLDAMGAVAVFVLAIQLATGYRGPGRSRRHYHAWVAAGLAAAMSVHGVLGLVHALAG